MRRIVPRAAALVSFVVALSPAAAPAAPPAPPKPQDVREVQRLFEHPGSLRLLPERVVAVEEVVAIAAVAEGLTQSDALARVTANAVEASVQCSSSEWRLDRGLFPYHRWIVGQTYWCYQYGADITYRVSQTAARVDGVCSASNPSDWKVSGGAGYSWVVVHHEASFSCTTPWWFPLNDTLWMEPAFNSYGNSSMTRSA
jgi:hypothetical protein